MLNVGASPVRRSGPILPRTMPRHRLFIPQPIPQHGRLEIDGEQAHYLSRVLRMKPGGELSVFDGSGDEFAAVIVEIRKSSVVLRAGELLQNDVESRLVVRLIQGISRGERMDFVVQKATELGVQEIRPVLTQYSVVKLDPERAGRRVQHWRKIARSACEQCGRNRVPLIAEPVRLFEYLSREADADCRLVLEPGATTRLRDLAAATTIDLLVGPEGGISDHEIDDAARVGFVSVSMGPRILRSETAALTALALVQGRWGDLQA